MSKSNTGSRILGAFCLAKRLPCANCRDKYAEMAFDTEPNTSRPSFDPTSAFQIRCRLAYLTSDVVASREQQWNTEVRKVATQLQTALEYSANHIYSTMKLHGQWRKAHFLVWTANGLLLQQGPNMSTEKSTSPIHLFMSRRSNGWRANRDQLEAILGLWSCFLAKPASIPVLLGPRPWFEAEKKAILVSKTRIGPIRSTVNNWIPEPYKATLMERGPSLLRFPVSCQPALTGIPFDLRLHEFDYSERYWDGYLLGVERRSSQFQSLAQDVFALFIARIATILEASEAQIAILKNPKGTQVPTGPPQGIEPGSPQDDPDDPELLKNLVCSLAEIIVSAGFGTKEEAFMTIVPALLNGLLPFDDPGEGLPLRPPFESDSQASGVSAPVGGVSQGVTDTASESRAATTMPPTASEAQITTDSPPPTAQAQGSGESIELQEIASK